MQQFHTTTETQTEQTLSYTPAESVAPLEQQQHSEAVDKLLSALESDTKKRQKWNKWLLNIIGAYIVVLLIAIPIMWLMHHKVGWLFRSFNFAGLFNVIGFALGELFLDKRSAAELAQLNDMRCIGALVDIWGSQGTVNYAKKTRKQAGEALTRLLPQLKASDAPLLKEAQRTSLRGVLIHAGAANSLKDNDIEFILAILKAFEQVGDWKSADCVKTLTSPANNKRVRAAAKECLPFLQALAEKQKPGLDLLRASSASEAANVAPDTLLRPALSTEEARPDTLLRAAE